MSLHRPAPLAALLLLAGSAVAQAPEARIAWWNGGLDAAFAEAAARNVPLMFVFIQDGEEANERIVTGVFTDEEYLKATKRAVVAVLSREAHPPKKETVDGEVREVCGKFGGCSCAAHKNLDWPARSELTGENIQTPLHLFVLPDKTVFERLTDVAAPGAYVDTLRRAQKKLGLGVGRAEYRAAMKAAVDARRLVDSAAYVDALKSAKAALEGVKGTKCAKDLEAILESVEKAAQGRIDEALKAEKAGDVYRALKLLDEGARDFAGGATTGAMRKEADRMRATKPGREAAAILARESRAAPAMAAAEKAVEERDFVRARRELEKVLKTAEGTPLATAAERRLAALKTDPDVKALFEKADRETAADAALHAADGLLRAGDKARAKAAFEAVLKDYAGTKAGDAAKKRLGAWQ